MLIFKRTEGISTTDIVGRLLLMSSENKNNDKYEDVKKIIIKTKVITYKKDEWRIRNLSI
jgi:hypothetical protein